jgi:hypothetical protein
MGGGGADTAGRLCRRDWFSPLFYAPFASAATAAIDAGFAWPHREQAATLARIRSQAAKCAAPLSSKRAVRGIFEAGLSLPVFHAVTRDGHTSRKDARLAT